MKWLSDHAINYPKRWFLGAGIVTATLAVMVALPLLVPGVSSFIPALRIDTDPENMLAQTEPVRMYHTEMKSVFGLYDMVVVGITNDQHSQGVFNRDSLNRIFDLTEYAKTLTWTQNGDQRGVIGSEIMAVSTVDVIEPDGPGAVRFEWLMGSPIQSDAAALDIARKAQNIPFLDNTLISDDGKAMALYIPIRSKKDSYRVAQALKEKVSDLSMTDTVHITGLPIAQDQFGIEMFKQMAISAPMAMVLIFVLMWGFFRHKNLIMAPLVVAFFAVVMTMGLLIVTGNTVHIMSSMIPIFIMPIAVLDAVHILSDFFDRYPKSKNRVDTLRHVMADLSKPMLYTTLTTSIGFASLVFTPIPPVQLFGLFIGFGVFAAWFLTITLIPAYIMLLPVSSLDGFGRIDSSGKSNVLSRFLSGVGRVSYAHAKWVIVVFIGISALAGYGISKVRINDNPVKWFEPNHEIRIADRELNQRFAGTYMAYLVLDASGQPDVLIVSDLNGVQKPIVDKVVSNTSMALADVEAYAIEQQDAVLTDDEWWAWEDVLVAVETKQLAAHVFKNPDVLRYMEGLQEHLNASGYVGKSNGLSDIVKTVHRDLFSGTQADYRIPDSANAVAQTLLTFEGSHRPNDLWHFVTPDFQKAVLWIQLKSGDNHDMNAVTGIVDEYIRLTPPPVELQHQWFGLTYINVIWQDKMVKGMLEAFIGSFVMVLIMMMILFRSVWWGLLSMVPLTVTIAFIYGVIGLVGKDYDMPVAVLSALSLGLAVDYAIHFLARSRDIRAKSTSWQAALTALFKEPARAIFRNVVVIGVGFLPLLAAPLVPYQTVGIFISSILVLAGMATLLILPAIMTLLQRILFSHYKED